MECARLEGVKVRIYGQNSLVPRPHGVWDRDYGQNNSYSGPKFHAHVTRLHHRYHASTLAPGGLIPGLVDL